MRRMGLDIGEKRIGVAISDPLGLTAQGLTVILRTALDKDIEEIRSLAVENEVSEIVYGLHKNMDGTVGDQAKRVRRFINHLHQVTGIPVVPWDERLTSKAADDIMIEGGMRRSKRKKKIDQVAATIILQGYLNQWTLRQGSSNE